MRILYLRNGICYAVSWAPKLAIIAACSIAGSFQRSTVHIQSLLPVTKPETDPHMQAQAATMGCFTIVHAFLQ